MPLGKYFIDEKNKESKCNISVPIGKSFKFWLNSLPMNNATKFIRRLSNCLLNSLPSTSNLNETCKT